MRELVESDKRYKRKYLDSLCSWIYPHLNRQIQINCTELLYKRKAYMFSKRKLFAVAQVVGVLTGLGGHLNVSWAAWPADNPIKLIIPSPPGGANDIVGRVIGDYLGRALQQTVVIENRGGAAGAIGIQAVAQAKQDGYTIGMISNTATFQDVAQPNVQWNLKRDLQVVAMIGGQPISISVPANSPYRSIAELFAAGKGKPDLLSYATSGLGTTQHLVGERLGNLAKMKWVHIPYKGGAPATTDLMGGQVPVAVVGLVPVLAHHKAGRLRILAVTSPTRDPSVPEVPTMAESGFPQIRVTQWIGLVMPKGTPLPIVARLSDEVNKMLSDPDVKARIMKAGLNTEFMGYSQFEKFTNDEADMWTSLIRELKIKME